VSDVQLLKDEPVGIGGWLILPLIILVIWALSFLGTLWVDIVPSFGADVWQPLTTPGSPVYSSYWAPYLIVSAILVVGLMVWAIALLVLFVQRRRVVPLLISLFFLAAAGAAVFEFVSVWHLSNQVPLFAEYALTQGAAVDLLRSLVPAAIWVPYFRLSVRVRNTFDR